MNKQDETYIQYNHLNDKYGEIIGGYDLAKELGYKSTASLRQAISRKQIEIQTFSIEKRKGKFAYTNDVIQWLKQLKEKGS